ncbi:MAG TPA: PPE family protein [Mycobacterium sp.]|nr:PPE family protein [Mycobacterium sp.]
MTSFAMLPPEITSTLMYSGPGTGPMLAAATAWNGLATELHTAATSYVGELAKLTGTGWAGASSTMMTVAVTPYITWMSATAAQALATSAQAKAAASAYQTALAATVPPESVAANRSQLGMLLATNILGRNAVAIAANEAQYQQMWAQDAAAMSGYAGASTAATRLAPFTAPPKITNAAGPTGAGEQSALASAMSAGYTNSFTNLANVSKLGLMANDSMGSTNMGMVEMKTFWHPLSNLPPIPESALGAGLTGARPALPSASLMGAVSADVGNAPRVGQLSVPHSWGTATPAIRLAVSESPAASAVAAPATGFAQGLSGVAALESLGAGAMGATAPRAIKGASFRGAGAGKGRNAPVKLDTVIAHLQKRRDAVQHWQVDQDGLDDLLEELSKKPGFHAVHVSAGGKTRSG